MVALTSQSELKLIGEDDPRPASSRTPCRQIAGLKQQSGGKEGRGITMIGWEYCSRARLVVEEEDQGRVVSRPFCTTTDGRGRGSTYHRQGFSRGVQCLASKL